MIGAIIQARLGSERLPRKILLPLPKNSKVTILDRVVLAAIDATTVKKVIIVTPDEELYKMFFEWPSGAPVTKHLWKQDYRDPLGEFYLAATLEGLDTIVRITADCPLLTSEEIDRVVTEYILGGGDYAYNHHDDHDDEGMKGDGMDVEVFSYEMLKKAHFFGSTKDREHVTTWIRENCEHKLIIPAPDCETLSLNTMEDYDKICAIWQKRFEKEKLKMT